MEEWLDFTNIIMNCLLFLVSDRETNVFRYLLKLKKTRSHEPVLGGLTQDYRHSIKSLQHQELN